GVAPAVSEDWENEAVWFDDFGGDFGTVNISVSGLTPKTAYLARIFATNDLTTALGDFFEFSTFGDEPVVLAYAPDPVDGTSATARGELVFTGADPTAHVWLCWGSDDFVWDGGEDYIGEFSSGDPLSFELDPLDYNTVYHYRFFASNSVEWLYSDPVDFKTLGVPVFGAVSAVAFSDFAIFTAELESAGVPPTTVTCHVGDTAETLLPLPSPQFASVPDTLSWRSGTLVPGATYHYAFKAENVINSMPVTVWSETNTVVIGNRELIWDNAAATKDTWDTALRSWHLAGAGNGSANFEHGDSARFLNNTTYALSLAENISAENVFVEVSGGNNNVNRWLLDGSATLTLHGALEFLDRNNNINNAVDNPLLAGPGAVRLLGGRFRLGNSANTFAGGLSVLAGQLDATLTGANASTIGTGAVALANPEVTTAIATLALNSSGSSATVNAPALRLDGDMNSAKIALGGAVDAAFGAFSREDGATLQIDHGSGGGSVAIAGIGGGLLPPWAVATSGNYLANAGGAVSAISDYATYPGVFTNGAALTPFIGAAWLTSTLDLLGSDIVFGGAILNNNVTVQNGTVTLDPDDSYFYVPSSAATISADIAGTGRLVKFGAGILRLTAGQTPDIVNQEGRVEFRLPAALDYTGNFVGSGNYHVRNNMMTLAGDEYDFNGMQLHSGGVTVGAGIHVKNLGEFNSGPTGNGADDVSAGSLLVITNGGRWTQTGGRIFRVGSAHLINHNAQRHDFVLTDIGSVLDLNGEELTMGQVADNRSDARYNSIRITNGAMLTNAAAFFLAYAQGGDYGYALIDGGARVHTACAAVGGGAGSSNGGGNYNTVVISGEGTDWDNRGGVFAVGSTGGGNTARDNKLIVANGAVLRNVGGLNAGNKTQQSGSGVFNNSITISNAATVTAAGFTIGSGHNAAAYDNLVDVCDGGIFELTGTQSGTFNINASGQGQAYRNVLRVRDGGCVTNLPALRVGSANATINHSGRAEVLDGGHIVMKGESGSRVALGFANNGSQHNPSHTNGLLIASSTGIESLWDFKGAHLNVGYNTSSASDRQNAAANENWVRASVGGTLTNITDIFVGSTGGNSKGNNIVLDGGAIHAATLRVVSGNRFEVIIGSAGVLPVALTGNAILDPDTRIVPSLTDRAQHNIWFPIITTTAGTITNDALFDPPQDDISDWRIRLSTDLKTLSVRAVGLTTLLIIR
ncbi:MAG: hypothetical protein FWG05_01560, partial [Kiritimatiellaeota bacterium]|nr:hypothetical protein [Kiritimatiellota bacterium]